MPSIGDRAPDFSARSTVGTDVNLRDYRGKYLVIYFYPKAFTPGCTRETKRFRDHYDDIKALGGEVIGISLDDLETQCEFGTRYEVGFPLIADEAGTISRAYGAKRALLPLDRRLTFLIDPDGVVVGRFHHELQINKHLDDVLGALKQRLASGSPLTAAAKISTHTGAATPIAATPRPTPLDPDPPSGRA